jgi:non-heme chloroperoxidase
MSKTHTIQGAAGVKLHVREFGSPNGTPILLIHGWSQNHLCWEKQCSGPLADEARIVTFDLRGHGMSDAPMQAEQYTDGDKWADDIANVIDDLDLKKPIVVAWSYGGYVIADYLRRHGQDNIGGINFVAAAVVLGPKAFGSLIGPTFLEHAPPACQDDLATNIAAIRGFLHGCFGKPISQEDFETALAFNMVVSPKVRGAMIQREVDFAPVLDTIRVPVLVTHGLSDTVVLPAMSELILQHCKGAQSSWLTGVGHAPFFEEPLRFNSELSRFARAARQ